MRTVRSALTRRRLLPALLAGIAMALTTPTGAASRDGRRRHHRWGYSGVYGPLWPGKVIYGDPGELPPDWRAYPLDFSDRVFVIQPIHRRVRTNFGSRPRKPRRR